MLKPLFDVVMARRADRLIDQVRDWLPADGPVLDLGSGTGHPADRLETGTGLRVVPADVADIHVAGRPPIVVHDGVLPFRSGTFSATLLLFMLAYPRDPVALLSEVRRVTSGPVILVQSLYCGRLGYLWLRAREFVWTVVAFHVSRAIGYVPATARFTMATRRFYDAPRLTRQIEVAGLRVREQRHRPVLPGGALAVAAFRLEPHE